MSVSISFSALFFCGISIAFLYSLFFNRAEAIKRANGVHFPEEVSFLLVAGFFCFADNTV